MEKQRTALVIIGGEHPPIAISQSLMLQADLVVAADSGYDSALQLGLKVDAIVGDMDSVQADLPAQRPGGPTIVRWPADKDYSDTELAIQWARGQGCKRIFLLGGGGGRIDHLLAIYSLFQGRDSPDRWYTRYDEMAIIRQYLGTPIRVGSLLSFFPLGLESCRARTRGLHWPLDGIHLSIGDCGLSNRMDADRLDVWVDSGRLLMVRTLQDGDTVLGSEL